MTIQSDDSGNRKAKPRRILPRSRTIIHYCRAYEIGISGPYSPDLFPKKEVEPHAARR